MFAISSSIFWCLMQSTLVCAVGLAISGLLLRRHAQSAVRVTLTSALVTIVLTVTIPFNLHLLIPRIDLRPTNASESNQSTAASDAPGAHENVDHSTGNLPSVPMAQLFELLRSRIDVRGSSLDRPFRMIANIIGLGIGLCFCFGVSQLILGVIFVIRLLRCSTPITDENVTRISTEVAAEFGMTAAPNVRVSPTFYDAAVAGWIRPVVILPWYWSEWSEEELRSAIAHELAHVKSHHTIERLIASIAMTFQFCNPFVHGLVRRMVLCHELVADQLAARIIGVRTYTRSLSSLAIRMDDKLGNRVSPTILPVYSGQLIRRITMLKSKEASSSSFDEMRRTWSLAAVLFVVFAGAAGVAVRSFADPPDEQRKNQTANQINFVSGVQAPASKIAAAKIEKEMFRRPKLNPESFALFRNALGVIRVKEIAGNPFFKAYADEYAIAISHMLRHLGGENPWSINLDAVEWIAFRPYVQVKRIPNPTSNEKSQFVVGSSGVVIRFHQEVDLPSWFAAHAPNSAMQTIEDVKVYELPLLFAEPGKCRIWSADARTVYVGFDAPQSKIHYATSIEQMVRHVSAGPKNANSDKSVSVDIKTPLESVNGGLVSIVLTDGEFVQLEKDLESRDDMSLEADERLKILEDYQVFKKNVQSLSLGMDISEVTPNLGIKLVLGHSSTKTATESAEHLMRTILIVQAAQQRRIATLEKKDPLPKEEVESEKAVFEWLKSVAITVGQSTHDGTGEVYLFSLIPQTLWKLL